MTEQQPEGAKVVVDAADLAQLEHLFETLEEAAADAAVARSLAVEDRGWASLTGDGTGPLDRDGLIEKIRQARVMAVANPLIRRATVLRSAYVWGAGVQIAADDPDVDVVVQGFLRAQADTFHGAQAREQRERAFATDGTYAVMLPTSPATGTVQARRVPVDDLTQVITNPQDRDDLWFVRRRTRVARLVLTPGSDGTTQASTRTVESSVYHPALGNTYQPGKPRRIDGIDVDWDTPVLLARVNPLDGMEWGVPDLLPALPWALGYKGFLEDWARLTKALSKFAFQATGKGSRAGQTRGVLAAAAIDGAPAGQTVITAEGQRFEAIGKSGATIDANSGRPLAAMVAAATDLPVTMLLADPGVTGARATAETLDRPLEEVLRQRRELHASIDRRVLDHVIQSAIRAPRGPLRGTRTVDPDTGRERWTLAGDVSDGVDVDFPPISQPDLGTLVGAIKTADDTGKMPPVETLKLLLRALGVDGADEIVDDSTDDDGQWIDPIDAARARSQTDGVYQGLAPGRTPTPGEGDSA